MSWSVSAVGKPAAVKKQLANSFEQAKKNVAHVPHEAAAVAAVESLVNAELDFQSDNGIEAVRVEAGGSACVKGASYPGNSQVSVKVEPIYCFLTE
jgi:hypothetical protein